MQQIKDALDALGNPVLLNKAQLSRDLGMSLTCLKKYLKMIQGPIYPGPWCEHCGQSEPEDQPPEGTAICIKGLLPHKGRRIGGIQNLPLAPPPPDRPPPKPPRLKMLPTTHRDTRPFVMTETTMKIATTIATVRQSMTISRGGG